jgi:hypothetical protein
MDAKKEANERIADAAREIFRCPTAGAAGRTGGL